LPDHRLINQHFRSRWTAPKIPQIKFAVFIPEEGRKRGAFVTRGDGILFEDGTGGRLAVKECGKRGQ
jgi:hypothetical protein